MPDKKSLSPKQPKKPGDWNPESPFDAITSLEELITMAPFKDASDSKGGSWTAASRIPTFLERKVVYLTELKGSPYQLRSDVIRDAIYIGLRILNMRYRSNPDWAAEGKMAGAIDKANLISRVKSQIDQIARPIEELWNGGDEAQAITAFEDFVGASVEIADEWHKMKLFQLIRNNRVLKDVAERCSPEVKKAVFGDRGKK